MIAETLQTIGIVALVGLLYVIGLKYLELLPAPSGEHAEGASAEQAAAAAEGGHT